MKAAISAAEHTCRDDPSSQRSRLTSGPDYAPKTEDIVPSRSRETPTPSCQLAVLTRDVNGGRRLIASSCRPTNFSNKRAVDLPPPAARAVALHVIAGKKGNRCVCSSVIYYFEYFT